MTYFDMRSRMGVLNCMLHLHSFHVEFSSELLLTSPLTFMYS